MPIESEVIEGITLLGVAGLPPVDCLIRHGTGGWTFHFRINGEAVLPDGRKVVINRRLAARATEQVGRKPRKEIKNAG